MKSSYIYIVFQAEDPRSGKWYSYYIKAGEGDDLQHIIERENRKMILHGTSFRATRRAADDLTRFYEELYKEQNISLLETF